MLGALVTGTGITALVFGGRVAKLALGLRPVLRVALDVDSWLREHPRNDNPTGRICARYTSLLRFISGWRDTDNRPYDALVIFAHSQGTVITSDLLRFLHRAKGGGSFRDYDNRLAGLDQMPIYLLTFGCPLRQLYGKRFPYLYDYSGFQSGHQPSEESKSLGVEVWLNGYRSGDYIGRDLWKSPNPWQALPAKSRVGWQPWCQNSFSTYTEFCLGSGAHTHYCDRTAPAIAKALDYLICHRSPPCVKPIRPY